MRHGNTSKMVSPCHGKSRTGDIGRSRAEKAQLRATSLYLIRKIVERHGGTLEMDLATDTININVPEKERVACAREIEEQIGSMCR
jgi:sensor histidine kinase regulating citrate/malate metabolism